MFTLIIQAGGKGNRLKTFTKNKPKGLISIRSKPLVSHLIDFFCSDNLCKEVIIIVDYKKEVFKKYNRFLEEIHKNISIKIFESEEYKGTAGGIKKVVEEYNIKGPILLSWCDILPETDNHLFKKLIKNIATIKDKVTIFYSDGVKCRWSLVFKDDCVELTEKKSINFGILGLFYIPDYKIINFLEYSGEFVRTLSEKLNRRLINVAQIKNLKEVGDFENLVSIYEEDKSTRFFNQINFKNNKVYKKAINNEYSALIKGEFDWYKKVNKLGFKDIPSIRELKNQELILENVKGKNIFSIDNPSEMLIYTKNCFYALNKLHSLSFIEANQSCCEEVYLNKTIKRLKSVSSLFQLKDKELIINNSKCINILAFDNWEEILREAYKKLPIALQFTPIHGDPTSSNNIMRDGGSICYIDPRGYFNKTGIFGDPRYDISKLYYSIVGGYDYFNRKLFDYEVSDNVIKYNIWRDQKLFEPSIEWLSNEIFNLSDIKLIHSFIWLSLTGYCLDDYDSIILSYFIGCQFFSE